MTPGPSDATLNRPPLPRPSAAPASFRSTIFMQAVAALLIANSHLEGLYPLRWLAGDGLLGNSMFFLLSGYGLIRSEHIKPRSFWSYYSRRILRIYPAIIVVCFVFEIVLAGHVRDWTSRDYIRNLIYPTHYHFVEQIMVFYILCFGVAKLNKPGFFLILAMILCLPYGWLYLRELKAGIPAKLTLGHQSHYMWWIFYFQVTLLGSWIASWKSEESAKPVPWGWTSLALSLLLYLFMKLAMVKGLAILGGSLSAFYPLLLLLTVLIIYLVFRLTTSLRFLAQLTSWNGLFWAVSLIGGLTLEIYLVHEFVFECRLVTDLVFPVNVGVFFGVSIGLAWAVSIVAGRLRGVLERIG